MSDERDGVMLMDPPDTRFAFTVTDVTGTSSFEASDFEPSVPAGTAAAALAQRFQLPDGPYALRDDEARFLDDRLPLREQIRPGTQLTLTPKTHLGGRD